MKSSARKLLSLQVRCDDGIYSVTRRLCIDPKPPEACAGTLGFWTRESWRLVDILDQVLGVIEAHRCEPQTAGGMRGPPRTRYASLRSGGATGRLHDALKDTLDLPGQVLGVIERICATPEPPEACAGPLG
ncbi:hypothetical protein GGG16DRAFT_119674 [Schizophyllum commune]